MKNYQLCSIITLIILTSCIAFPSHSKAQKNFTKGYIVTNQNDTIKGLINHQKWKINPRKIAFKKNEESSTEKFRPLDIKGFRVENSFYIGTVVDIETSPMSTSRLEEGPDLNLEKDTVFLEVLFRGEKSLYHYGTQKGKDNFYIMRNDSIELLIYKKYYITRSGTMYQQEKNTYKGQLSIYLNNCPVIAGAIEDVQYKPGYLKKLFVEYYSCINATAAFAKKKGKKEINVGIIAGGSITDADFHSNSLLYMDKPEFTTSTNFIAGISVDIIFPRNNKKWALRSEVMYYSYLTKGEYEDNAYITEAEIGSKEIDLTLLLRYRYHLKNSKIFINAGLMRGYSFDPTNYKRRESLLNGDITSGKAIDEDQKYKRGLIAGMGYTYKKISIEARYMAALFDPFVKVGSSIRKYLFVVGYTF